MTTKPTPTPYDYQSLFQHISKLGKDMYGIDFTIDNIDKPVINRLLAYFLKDEEIAEKKK